MAMSVEDSTFEAIRTLVLFDPGDISAERAAPGKLLYEKVAFKDGATWYPLTGDGLSACLDECRSVIEWAIAGEGMPASDTRVSVVIVVASGDAAASQVISRLVREGLHARTAVLALPCGEGNRLAMTAGFGSSLPQAVLTGTNRAAQAWWTETVGRAVDGLCVARGRGALVGSSAVRVDTWSVRVQAVESLTTKRPPRGSTPRVFRIVNGVERPATANTVTTACVCGMSLGIWAQVEYERRAGKAAGDASLSSTDASTCGVTVTDGRVRCDWGSAGSLDRLRQLAGAVVTDTGPEVTRMIKRLVLDGKVLAEGRSLPSSQALVFPNLPAWSRGTDLWPLASPAIVAWAMLPESERASADRLHNPFHSERETPVAPAVSVEAPKEESSAPPQVTALTAEDLDDDDEGEANPFADDTEVTFFAKAKKPPSAHPSSSSGLYPPGYGPKGKLPPKVQAPPAPAPPPAPVAPAPTPAVAEDHHPKMPLPSDKGSGVTGAIEEVAASMGVSNVLGSWGQSAAAASADVLAVAEQSAESDAKGSGVGLPAAADGRLDMLAVGSLFQLGLACSTGSGLGGGIHRLGRCSEMRMEMLPLAKAVGVSIGEEGEEDDAFAGRRTPSSLWVQGACAFIQCDHECIRVALPAILEVRRAAAVPVVVATPQAMLAQPRLEAW
jgi:hypothetical protein